MITVAIFSSTGRYAFDLLEPVSNGKTTILTIIPRRKVESDIFSWSKKGAETTSLQDAFRKRLPQKHLQSKDYPTKNRRTSLDVSKSQPPPQIVSRQINQVVLKRY